MSIAIFAIACIMLLWAVLIFVISSFFRGMALISLGVELIHIAGNSNYPLWLVFAGGLFVLFPLATWFRRTIFGE